MEIRPPLILVSSAGYFSEGQITILNTGMNSFRSLDYHRGHRNEVDINLANIFIFLGLRNFAFQENRSPLEHSENFDPN